MIIISKFKLINIIIICYLFVENIIYTIYINITKKKNTSNPLPLYLIIWLLGNLN